MFLEGGKKSLKIVKPFIALVALFPLLSCSNYVKGNKESTAINYAIKLHPKTELLKSEDMDVFSCGEVVSPGFIKADLNNDGIEDYALLLKSDVEDYNFKGYIYDSLPLWIVILLGTASEEFRVVYDESILTSPPSGVGIEKSNISNLISEEGIMLYFCERSATVLHWDGEEIIGTVISD